VPRDLLGLRLGVRKKEKLGVAAGELAQKHFKFFLHTIETEMLKTKKLFKYIIYLINLLR
jgi:hypothetical protein